jgi:hypothetical protein
LLFNGVPVLLPVVTDYTPAWTLGPNWLPVIEYAYPPEIYITQLGSYERTNRAIKHLATPSFSP